MTFNKTVLALMLLFSLQAVASAINIEGIGNICSQDNLEITVNCVREMLWSPTDEKVLSQMIGQECTSFSDVANVLCSSNSNATKKATIALLNLLTIELPKIKRMFKGNPFTCASNAIKDRKVAKDDAVDINRT